MWHALRAELAYTRSYLLGGLGIAAGVVSLVSVIFWLVGDHVESHVAAGLRGMFLIMAPPIVGFVAQATRAEERRARLLLAGPLTPLAIGGATVLLPVVLLGVGVVAALLVMGAEALVTGRLERASADLVGFVGGQMFAYTLLGILAQEAAAAHQQRRRWASLAGWGALTAAVLLLAVLYLVLAREYLTWTQLFLGHVVVALASGAASVALYAGRNDFTR